MITPPALPGHPFDKVWGNYLGTPGNSPTGRCRVRGKVFPSPAFRTGTKWIEKSLVITVRKERSPTTELITGEPAMVQT